MAIPRRKPKYRSGLEEYVGYRLEQSSIVASHESETLKYIVPEQKKRYLVDFTLEADKDIILECKGQFTSADRKKMLLIRDQYPGRRIIMLFGRANNKLSKKSPTTYADWCDKNEIAWVDLATFKENPKCLFDLRSKKVGTSTSQPKRKRKPSKKLVRG